MITKLRQSYLHIPALTSGYAYIYQFDTHNGKAPLTFWGVECYERERFLGKDMTSHRFHDGIMTLPKSETALVV